MNYVFHKSIIDERSSLSSVILFKDEDTNCDGTCYKVNTCPRVNEGCK